MKTLDKFNSLLELIHYFSNEEKCNKIHKKYFPRENGNLCIVLLKKWYEPKEGDDKHWCKNAQGVLNNIPPQIDLSRYEEYDSSFLITNQWGLDANAEKDSSFVKLLKDIFGENIITTTQNQFDSYEVSNLHNNWTDILKKAGIQEIRIHINKK